VTFICNVHLCLSLGGASALVTFICVLCTLRTQLSRSICNFTLYSNNNNNNNLTINMQVYAPQMPSVAVNSARGRERCDCSCDIHLCSLHSAHANLTIHISTHHRCRALQRTARVGAREVCVAEGGCVGQGGARGAGARERRVCSALRGRYGFLRARM
jgi:hypothetical protein